MKIQEHYSALGANYNTIRSICCRKGFETTEIAYEYWKSQQDKKAKLKQLADTLGIKVESVKQRGKRRGYYKVDDTLLETKWKNIFEFEGERLAIWRQLIFVSNWMGCYDYLQRARDDSARSLCGDGHRLR